MPYFVLSVTPNCGAEDSFLGYASMYMYAALPGRTTDHVLVCRSVAQSPYDAPVGASVTEPYAVTQWFRWMVVAYPLGFVQPFKPIGWCAEFCRSKPSMTLT